MLLFETGRRKLSVDLLHWTWTFHTVSKTPFDFNKAMQRGMIAFNRNGYGTSLAREVRIARSPGIDADPIPPDLHGLALLVTDGGHVTDCGPIVADDVHLVSLARINSTHGPINTGATVILDWVATRHKSTCL